MPLPRLALCSLLLSAPLSSFAQSADPAPTPRFYGGLGVYSSAYNGISKVNGSFKVPLQATLGYQLRPRLAVQLGLAYSAGSSLSADPTIDPATGQSNNSYLTRRSSRSTSLALLTRYTLTRQAAHRLQFDLLGGFTLEHVGLHESGYYTDTQQSPTVISYDYRYGNATFLLTLGASARYRLGQRLELVYDLTTNRDLSTNRQYPYNGLTGSTALGLRYRFGKH